MDIKIIYLLLLFAFLQPFILYSQIPSAIEWGMSREKVMAVDTTAGPLPEISEDKLYGWGRSFGAPARFEYVFINDHLTEVLIFLFLDDMEAIDAIVEYNNQYKNLKKLYGQEDAFKIDGDNEDIENDTDNWGYYLELGKLEFFIYWETKIHIVSLFLKNYSGDITMLLGYKDIRLK